MNKEIKYNGYTAVPSDNQAPDGELALSLNLINDDGAIRPLSPPRTVLQLPPSSNWRVIGSHKTSTFQRFIAFNNNPDQPSLAWVDADKQSPAAADFHTVGSCLPGTSAVYAMGNMLIAQTPLQPLKYFFWDAAASQYRSLGTQLPPLDIEVTVNTTIQTSFDVEGTRWTDPHPEFNLSDIISTDAFNTAKTSSLNLPLTNEQKSTFIERAFAAINLLSSKISRDGKFYAPFFIRFAYTLYDGSRAMFTAPQLIIPSTTGKPLFLIEQHEGKSHSVVALPAASLSFKFPSFPSAWADIITGVDLLVSPMLLGYTADNAAFDGISQINSEDENNSTIGTIHLPSYYSNGNESILKLLRQQGITHTSYTRNSTRTRLNLEQGWRYVDKSYKFNAHGTQFVYAKTDGHNDLFMLCSPIPDNDHANYANYELTQLLVEDPDEANAIGLPNSAAYKIYDLRNYGFPNATDSDEGVWIVASGAFNVFEVKNTPANNTEFIAAHFKSLVSADDKAQDPKGQNDLYRKISNNSSFHLLKHWDAKQWPTGYHTLNLEPDDIPSIPAKEAVADEYRTGDIVTPGCISLYNNRLNLSCDQITPYGGESLYSLLSPPYTGSTSGYQVTRAWVEISENGQLVAATRNLPAESAPFSFDFAFWLYYPNPNAKYLGFTLSKSGSPTQNIKIPLTRHETLNGAYAFNDLKPLSSIAINTQCPQNLIGLPIHVGNKIYTSEVNNPFVVPPTGINTVGTGRIDAICSAAKALSQGQFGQFPLYAFTSEGVWALEVAANGSYSARQPITRDVILPNTTPLQLDSAVLFPSRRGIMLLTGSQTQCISDYINSNHPFNVNSLPGASNLHSMLGHPSTDTCIPLAPFSQFLANCGMIYDYHHQRISVFNPQYSYAYVYSLKSQLWSMAHSDIQYSIPSYPNALAINSSGNLVDLSLDSLDSNSNIITSPGLLVTRPLKLDTPDILKTIDNIIQRGDFAKGHVKSVLYGSRDLINWHLVWSSTDHYLRGFRGTPYKYFRIALVCNLNPGESIHGASIQFTPRLTNTPR